jgi:hypothetical protein
MASLGDRLGALFGAPAPSAPAPVRNTTPVYTSVPLPQAPARYVPAATQRNTYTGGMGAPASRGFSAPAPRRDVVQSLFELASQRSAPVRSLGVSPVVALPVNRAVQTPRMGLSAIPGIGNVLNAAAQQQAPRPGMAMIPGLGNAMAAAAPYAAPPRNRVSAAGEVADALMQRAIAGQQALENQMFDVQIQQTKDIAGPGYANEDVEDRRYEQQVRQLDDYRRRIQAVEPYVAPSGPVKGPPPQPSYNPLSSANTGGPRSGSPTGSGDSVAAATTLYDLDQVQYEIARAQEALRGGMTPMGWQNDPDAAARLLDLRDLQEQLTRTGRMTVPTRFDDRDWGETAGDVLGYDFGKPIGDAIKEYGGQGAEWFFRTPVGEQAITFLNGLNKPYEWNADVSGDQWYNAATGNYPQGEGRVTSALGPVGAVLDMSPDTAIALAFYAANPELREGVIQAYEQGYSSPEYIALMEESGVEDYAPQFEPGGFAVHEYLIGQTDDWPPALRDLVRLGEAVVMDPLTYLTVVGGAGKGLRAIGKAMATAEDSSGLTRVAGRAIETTGGVVEIGARAPDAIFEAPIAGFNWWRGGGRPAPGRPGLLQLSPDQQVMDAHTQAAHAAGLVSRNTDVGETVLGPDQAMADFHASNPEPPTHSTVEDAADIADGLVPPPSSATTGPRIVRPDTGTVGAHTYVPSSATTTPFVRLPPAPSDAPPVYWHTMTNSAGVTTHTAYVGYTGNVRVVQRGQSVKTQVIDGDTGEWVTTQSEMIPSGAGDPLEASRDVDQAFSDAIHEARISGQPDTAPIGRAGGATPQTNPEHEAPPSSTVTESEASPGRGPSSTVAEPEQPGQTVGRREPVRGREPEREPEPVRTGHQPQRIADPPENAANLDGATRPSAEPVSVSAIPDEFPRIQAAVARGGKLPDTTGRTPGESYFTPVYGGSRLPDAAITRAVVDGDLDAMRAANQLADEVDRLLPFLTDHPWYRGMLTEGGQGIHGLDVVPRMSRDQAEALVEMNRHTSRSQNPVHIAAGMGKAVLEKAKELEFLAAPYAEMHRTITGVNPVNTPDDVLFGFTWTGTGATGPSHRVQYLMERFVTTSSDEYANTILDWLRTNRGNDVLNTTNGPIPYLQGIPDPFRDDVLEVLEAARANYRAVVNASDADFASGAWREGVATTPRSADQLAGGLKGSSKQASKMVEKWLDAQEPKRRRSWIVETASTNEEGLLPAVMVDGFGGELDGEIIVLGDRFPAIATEQSPSRAMAFVDDSVPMGNIDELYFLSDTESWVGIGSPKGVSLRFDPKRIRGQVADEGFPATASRPAFSYLIGREANPSVYRDALVSVSIDPRRTAGTEGDFLRAIQERGWIKVKEADGVVEYRRPANSKTPKRTPADDWAGSPTRNARKPQPYKGKPRGALGFVADDPIGDLRGRGWLRGKLEQAQRTADDAAVPNVQNRLLAFLNETAAPGFDRKTTEYLNSPLPGWSPPNRKQSAWAPDEWTVFDALQWGHNEKVRNADFDYHAFVNHIGEVQAGIPPRMSAAEKKAARAVAKANGDPMPNFSLAEKARTAAHVAVNANDAYLRQIRQASLFGPISGPAGFVGDVVGNAWSAIVNGHFGAATDVLKPWKTIGAARTYRTTRVPVEMVNPWEMQSAADGFMTFHRNAHQAADALMTDVLRETGQMLPIDMYPAGTFREVPVSGKPSLNAAVENRGVLTRAAANLWTVTAVKDGRTATDLVGRTSIAKRVYADTVRREGMLAFRKLVIEKAGLENADQIIRDILAVAEQSAKDAGVPWKGNFSPADIKKATEGQSYSNPLARGWQSELNRAMDIAMTEQKRAYFSYKNTRADEAVANVLMFHYWQTRASYMHLRAALRHPVLLNGYYKIFEELRERSEQGGTGYLGPMYKFMTSPSGIYAAVEPLGFLIPMTLIDMQDQEGNPLRVLQNQVNPVIGTLLAVAGISDNVPNVTGLRTTQRWLVNMGNSLVANGVDMDRVPLLGRVWDNNTMQLRMPIDEAVSSILQEINQWWSDKGVPVGDFAPFDRGANERDQLNTWVLKGVEAEYGPMDPNATSGPWGPNGAAWAALDDALDALTTGTPNAIADEAERQYALEGLIAAMAAPFVPGGVITRSEYRDQQIAGNAADDPAASLNRDIVTSGSPTWEIMQQQYNTIGTPEQQRIYDMYLDMLMNPDEMGTVISRTPGGKLTVIRPSQIQGMSDAEREDFVNRWIAQNPGFEEAILAVQQGRDAFKAANPQFQEFKEYQKFVYNEDGKGIRAIRTTLERENPNFGRKIKEYRDYLKSQGITGPELERRLDAWAAGVDGYRAVMGIPIKNGDKVLPVYDPSTNPYASSAFAGMNAGGGASGSGGSGGKGSKLTKGPDGKLYNEDGQMVNSEGKPINDKGQVIDDYWYPDKVAERLAHGVAKYDLANQLMEEQFGDLWNQQTGKWEEWANSSSERRKLGYGGIPYALPEKSDLMREFEAWRAANGGGTVEDWFVYLMNEPGYGVMADPAVTLGYGETESAPTSLGGRLDALWNGGPAGGAPVNGWLWNILHS